MREAPLPDRTRVVVIGGGPVGLVASLLLSERGVPNRVIERRREPRRAPAAHVLRARPMEVLDGLGVGDAIRRAAPPLALDCITWCTTLGGTEIGRLDLRPPDPRSGERGPEPWTNCPQNVLEPILLRAAAARPEARIVRGATCVGIDPRPDGISVDVRGDDGTEHRIHAAFAIAADGAGSPTRRRLGIPMQGAGPLARFLMVHFEADLAPWIEKRSGPLLWVMNPESSGCLIVHDPHRSHVFMMPCLGTGSVEEEERAVPTRLAAALAVPVTPKILSVDVWSPHVQVAERYREGRVFLAGDAAHRFPPTGGLGLNTGILDAFDLAGRLARVENGADAALLGGYERSCRPVALRNAEESFENLKRLAEIPRVIGAWSELASLEQRIATLSRDERNALDRAIEAQRSHFLGDGALPGPMDAEPG